MTTAKKEKITQLRKLTVKSVFGAVDVEDILKTDDKRIDCMEVYGVATRAKPGESDYGSYTRFTGQFRAKNCATGEMFRSNVMLLPKFLEEELAAVMVNPDTGEMATSEFAVRISVIYDKTSVTKYVYVADTLIEPQESNALKALEERIAANALLLADKSGETEPEQKKGGKK